MIEINKYVLIIGIIISVMLISVLTANSLALYSDIDQLISDSNINYNEGVKLQRTNVMLKDHLDFERSYRMDTYKVSTDIINASAMLMQAHYGMMDRVQIVRNDKITEILNTVNSMRMTFLTEGDCKMGIDETYTEDEMEGWLNSEVVVVDADK